MTLRVLYLVIALIAAPLCASAADPTSSSRSTFGFAVELPSGWVLLGPNEAAGKTARLTPNQLGLKASQKDLDEYCQRVKKGKVEFYLDALLSTEQFTNNISLQLEDEANDYSGYTPEEIRTFCTTLSADLSKTWGEPVSVKGCEVVSSNNSAVLAFSYIVPTQEKFILQYVIPFNEKQTMLLVGGGHLNKEVIGRMQMAIRALAAGITGRRK